MNIFCKLRRKKLMPRLSPVIEGAISQLTKACTIISHLFLFGYQPPPANIYE